MEREQKLVDGRVPWERKLADGQLQAEAQPGLECQLKQEPHLEQHADDHAAAAGAGV